MRCVFLQLSKFLQTMEQQHNLVRVKELTKGVESIVEVDWKNPEWVKHYLKFSNSRLTSTQSRYPFLLILCLTLILYRLRSFNVPETDVEAASVQDGDGDESPYHPPEITTLYSVSARLEPLFVDANKRCLCVFVSLRFLYVVRILFDRNQTW